MGKVICRTEAGLAWIAVAVLGLSACASTAVDPTVPAFADAATRARAGFEAARAQEADAFAERAIAETARSGRLTTRNCRTPEDAAKCAVVLSIDGSAVNTGAVGERVAQQADALADYGEALQAFASAKDLDQEQAAIQKLGTAAGTVFAAAGVPGVATVTTLAADLLRQARLRERRRDLLRIARAVDPAIAQLSQVLTADTRLLRTNILLARTQAIADLQTQYVAAPRGGAEQRAIAHALFDAADSTRRAASLAIDYGGLARAHRAMIASLSDPRTDLSAAIREITQLAGEVEATREAFEPKARR